MFRSPSGTGTRATVPPPYPGATDTWSVTTYAGLCSHFWAPTPQATPAAGQWDVNGTATQTSCHGNYNGHGAYVNTTASVAVPLNGSLFGGTVSVRLKVTTLATWNITEAPWCLGYGLSYVECFESANFTDVAYLELLDNTTGSVVATGGAASPHAYWWTAPNASNVWIDVVSNNSVRAMYMRTGAINGQIAVTSTPDLSIRVPKGYVLNASHEYEVVVVGGFEIQAAADSVEAVFHEWSNVHDEVGFTIVSMSM
ncbi:MAG TPA: hypothetical protein VMH78_04535 [Thermoplasmata archaeon]|nr:hypothetical protein [Thermoplasmata archaeon]